MSTENNTAELFDDFGGEFSDDFDDVMQSGEFVAGTVSGIPPAVAPYAPPAVAAAPAAPAVSGFAAAV
ncbi:MAG TPA: hypothetical protein VLC09_22040, partial [Polyangiaceae bacterium]|nr:hypothetical protein [Polyangiaceae bacterium]